jgi:hypothetical protein
MRKNGADYGYIGAGTQDCICFDKLLLKETEAKDNLLDIVEKVRVREETRG